ncbi:hypothetical protein ATI61_119110 [Archangium gephyra]|uniref:Uncharacterized protein n=1 Tax=Archangium gephyra TaxID=48 RepID=A0AAC8Q9L1_9BACT|nr:hypothetical protein [Archangium gephyra]AKJ03640.1 Hypothetical protein AA314_05266 [Archangium gephyra]REG22580.1 hypothetical protein ATI61_119110 [Archangium gephyra]
MLASLLLASLLATSPALESAPAADPTVSFAHAHEGRHARLLDGVQLAASFHSDITPDGFTDALHFGRLHEPLRQESGGRGGGAINGEVRQVLALVLGLFIGFGTGHLLVRDTDGFLLFLVVDVAIIVVSSVFRFAVGGWFWGLGGVALLVSHVIQGIDALGKAGGPRIVDVVRERAVQVADVSGGRDAPTITTRAFAFNF